MRPPFNQIPNSRDEVWWAYTSARLRQLRDEKPSNLVSLVHAALHLLQHAAYLPTTFLRRAPPWSATAMNAVRILTRIVPILLEVASPTHDDSAAAAATAPPFDYRAWLFMRGVDSVSLAASLGILTPVVRAELFSPQAGAEECVLTSFSIFIFSEKRM
jgi:hypothetical protein